MASRKKARSEEKGQPTTPAEVGAEAENDGPKITEEYLEDLRWDASFNVMGGEIPNYIPQLKNADENQVGIALTFVSGESILIGDAGLAHIASRGVAKKKVKEPESHDEARGVAGQAGRFTIQSISKVFSLLYVLEELGHDRVFKRVGKEPTGDAFNASAEVVAKSDKRIPSNPLINVGAILMTSLFQEAARRRSEEPFAQFKGFVEKLCGVEKGSIEVDEDVFMSEKLTGHNNRALAWQMSADGILDQERQLIERVTGEDVLDPVDLEVERSRRIGQVSRVEEVLDNYFRQCSLVVNCAMLSHAAAVLANGGMSLGPGGERLVERNNVRTVVALMSSCGMYDGSGAFSHEVGMPAKSGVGGGIMAVVPGRLGVAVFAPPLDKEGNSVRGGHMLRRLSKECGVSVFHRLPSGAMRSRVVEDEVLTQIVRRIQNHEIIPDGCRKEDYIPELGAANARHFGASILWLGPDGGVTEVHGGESDQRFTAQSIGALFGLLYALNHHWDENVFLNVGKEPTGLGYDEIKWKKITEKRSVRYVPFNPMINAGAIVVSAMIPGSYHSRRDYYSEGRNEADSAWSASAARAFSELVVIDEFLEFVRELCGNPQIDVDWRVFESERQTGYRNRSLAWRMNDEGVFQNLMARYSSNVDVERVEDILSVYFRICSLSVSCRDLAMAAAVLANGGRKIGSQEFLIRPHHVGIATAMMSSCGLFNGSGEFASSVGVPSKSGISGGLVGVVPGRAGIAAYNPIVDKNGNSFLSMRLFEKICELEGLSVFEDDARS